MIPLEALEPFIGHLESSEAELLCWGDTEGYFSQNEWDDLLDRFFRDDDPEDVEDELIDRGIVIRVRNPQEEIIGYRSRTSEAIRLYRNLRQWFVNQPIEQSRTLVSDYRFLRRPRSYPNQNISLEDCLKTWNEVSPLEDRDKVILKLLVSPYDLAGFQVRGTTNILRAYKEHRTKTKYPTATIISAGTGSGKTLAFYLPALTSLASDVLDNPVNQVRVLAIYPRIELLKDQFNEAYEQCRKLDPMMTKEGGRKLRIAAFFGPTKYSPRTLSQELRDNNKKSFHYQFLRCPTVDCRGQLHWHKEDIDAEREKAKCSSCGYTVAGDEVSFTRSQIMKNPPDILFTTTEMLNQNMGNSNFRHVFGIGNNLNIPLVLLDEVHTYSGRQGAQTAYLLRRWMALSKNKPHFVGLSATLRDAEIFFSTLTGVNLSRVQSIKPSGQEMVEKGSEYLLALRGDPVSQTALLSTTIQATMLTHRILDEKNTRKSDGIWGTKTFVFTDKLDVNNRLYFGYLDAEGWTPWQQPNHNGPLARLRSSSPNVSPKQLSYLGQDWSMSKAIGYGLDSHDQTKVKRTSSQDPGYDYDSDVVITTATLELGFNDPDVGAVIQHKAPTEMASYLQRKGRAGRRREMHPWMLVVLSDFGRDRVAYQQYENLIDPEITLQRLPIENDHIQKMQAAQTVLDWISTKLNSVSIWRWLSNPQKLSQIDLEKLKAVVNDVMTRSDRRGELARYIGYSLQLDEQAVDRLLWQSPRSIYLEFLPTLRRKLNSNWGSWSESEQKTVEWAELADDSNSPLPRFIPGATFRDLSMPDLRIGLTRRGELDWKNSMNFFHGLQEFAPGRISKRFAIQDSHADWAIPISYIPSQTDAEFDVEIEDVFGTHISLLAEITDKESQLPLSLYQPHEILPQVQSNRGVTDSSQAFIRWRSIFLPPNTVEALPVPSTSGWGDTLQQLWFFTHSQMTPLELIRYSKGSDAQHKFRGGAQSNIQFNWVTNASPVGVGIRLHVDACLLRFSISADLLKEWLQDDAIQRSLRPQYFADTLKKHDYFKGDPFKAKWVSECFLAHLALEKSQSETDLKSCIESICSGNGKLSLLAIPEMLFQLGEQYIENESVDDVVLKFDQLLQTSLRTCLSEPEMIGILNETSRCLYAPLVDIADFLSWSRQILGNTLAAGVSQALCTLFPNVDDRSINADVEIGIKGTDEIDIWVSETESGGIGIISALQDLYRTDPMRVLNALHKSLQPGDYERLDRDLQAILEASSETSPVERSLAGIRDAHSLKDRIDANNEMKNIFSSEGFLCSHSFLAVLHSRILRPGSTSESDKELLRHLSFWDSLEDDINLELPIHIVSFVLAWNDVGADGIEGIFKKLCEIQSRLWVRGSVVREESLKHYNQFDRDNNQTERLLGAMAYVDRTPETRYTADGWLEVVHQYLRQDGQVDLIVNRADSAQIPKILATLHVKALDLHGLLFHPRLVSVARLDEQLRLRFELAEALH